MWMIMGFARHRKITRHDFVFDCCCKNKLIIYIQHTHAELRVLFTVSYCFYYYPQSLMSIVVTLVYLRVQYWVISCFLFFIYWTHCFVKRTVYFKCAFCLSLWTMLICSNALLSHCYSSLVSLTVVNMYLVGFSWIRLFLGKEILCFLHTNRPIWNQHTLQGTWELFVRERTSFSSQYFLLHNLSGFRVYPGILCKTHKISCFFVVVVVYRRHTGHCLSRC